MVQLLHVRRHTQRRHGIKHPERVTPLQQLVRVPLMQRPQRQQDDIVNHVRVRDVVHECREGLDRVCPEIVKLGYELFGGLVGDGRCGEGEGFVGEEVSIVGRGELHPEVWGSAGIADV